MIQPISAPTLAPAAVLEQVRALFALLARHTEPIELVEQRYNFLPQRFCWRGDVRRVRAVARVWEHPGRARRYFEVVCGPGHSFVLFQDLQVGTWHVSL